MIILIVCALTLFFGAFYSHFINLRFNAAKTFFDEIIQSKDKVAIRGEIYKKEYKNEKYRLYLRSVGTEEFYGPCFNALIYSDREMVVGSTVEILVEPFEMIRQRNEGGFNQEEYLKSQKIPVQASLVNAKYLRKPRIPFKEFLYRLRRGISLFYEDNLPGEESGLLSSMVLGDKTGLDEEAKELFRMAGLTHILSISGLHLNILCALIYKFLRKRGLSFVKAGVVAGVIVFIYGLFSYNPISLVRASTMFILSLGADISGRAYDMLSALGASALILLIWNPFVYLNAGFVLSFAAVLGIVFVAKPLSDRYKSLCQERWEAIYRKDNGRFYAPNAVEIIALNIISGLGISLFSYPIVAFFFSEIPVYVIILNLFVLPLMGMLLVCGLVFGLTFFSPGMIICHLILYYYEFLASVFLKIPGSTIVLARPGVVWILIYYAGLFFGVFIVTKDWKKGVNE